MVGRAVTEALREWLDRVRKKKEKRLTVDEMLAIGRRIRNHIKGPVQVSSVSAASCFANV